MTTLLLLCTSCAASPPIVQDAPRHPAALPLPAPEVPPPPAEVVAIERCGDIFASKLVAKTR